MKAQDTHFDEIAAEYDSSIPIHVMRHLTERRVDLARSLVASGRVLDVGCGTGTFLAAMPASYERVGVDVSAGMLEIAARKGLDVARGSGGELPFPADSFDLVTTFAVLHHLIDPQLVRATLAEMARVTKPGGWLIVWDHNPWNPYWRFLMSRSPQDQGDEKLVPAKLILEALATAGARDAELRRMTFTPDFTPPRALPVVARVERGLERVPGLRLMAAHNVVVARG